MAKYVSLENIRFWLYEVHKSEALFEYLRFEDYDRESIDILLDSIKALADKEYYPCFEDMDAKPAYYKDGGVVVHPQVGVFIKESAEMGLIGATFDYDHGGMQLPEIFQVAGAHILECANNSATGYVGLTTGAAQLITSYGDQSLIDTYVPKMIAGEWMGTMALTEPQAGSSLSDIETSATPTDDGHYKISGQKIFISGGDHQFSDNFIHLTLARIDGAPAGTKGISLFVVPKYRPRAGGEMAYNDVQTVADFQKLGQRGYCTTHLAYGENEDCHGWLIGEANKGLKCMFQMMNAARIDVGASAASTATAAYYASLQYAQERPQGRPLTQSGKKDADQAQTLIFNHPDVRRMLLLQKVVVEGAMSLLLECSKFGDLHKVTEAEEEREKYNLLLDFLTPIAKTYPSEMGQTAISNGLQVLGGFGFTMDFPLQQYYRDIRIMSLYEGTTGIQSLDLLGRKVTMKNGKALQLIMAEMQTTIGQAAAHDSLKKYAQILGDKLKLTQEVLGKLIGFALKGEFQTFLADASLFMEFASTIIIGWQWLKMAITAQEALNDGNKAQTQEFYQSKIHAMKFFFHYEMPKTDGLAQTLMDPEMLTIKDDDGSEMIF